MEGADIGSGLLQDQQEVRVNLPERIVHLLPADSQLCKVCAVKAAAIIKQRTVAACTDVGNDPAHNACHVDRGRTSGKDRVKRVFTVGQDTDHSGSSSMVLSWEATLRICASLNL